jgi:hypothetical protein
MRAINLIGKELSCRESRYRIVTDIARFIPDKFNKLFFCNTIQHNTIQYNAIQYSTIRYNIIQLKLVNKNKRSRKSCYWQSEIFAKYRVSTPGCSNHLFSVEIKQIRV